MRLGIVCGDALVTATGGSRRGAWAVRVVTPGRRPSSAAEGTVAGLLEAALPAAGFSVLRTVELAASWGVGTTLTTGACAR
jgi:hypothetical protein